MTDEGLESVLPITLRRRLAMYACLGYWIVLSIATHIPLNADQELPGSDKLWHLLAYAGLGGLMASAVALQGITGPTLYATVFGVGAVYAVIDELLQIPVGRHCDVWDMLADWIGLGIGLVWYWLMRQLLPGLFEDPVEGDAG